MLKRGTREQVSRDVVEPEALAQVVEQLGRLHGVISKLKREREPAGQGVVNVDQEDERSAAS